MKTLTFHTPPQSICIIRLSAIGDVAHVVALVNRLQEYWPNIKITWIIGKIEYQLVKNMPGINFVIFDKKQNLSSYKAIYKSLKNIRFDALLMLQAALRASIMSTLISAKYKIGFDKKRSRDAQWLFSNHRINGPERVHVVDTFFQFLSILGVPDKEKAWTLPLNDGAIQFAQKITTNKQCVVINPNSSVSRRNWTVEGYAQIIDYLVTTLKKDVILTGSPSTKEIEFNQSILQHCSVHDAVIDLTAKTHLQELAAVIKHAELVIAPDTGPAHIATAVNTPVISLFADTNPNRARPYLSPDWVVSEYNNALKTMLDKSEDNSKWGTRIRKDKVMDMIDYEQVKQRVNEFYEQI